MKNTFRIGYWRYFHDDAFNKLTAFVRNYSDCIDELALLTEYSHHGYYPLEDIAQLCAVLKKRIAALKAAGVPSVGINILDTLGHIDEAWDVLTLPPFGTLMGHDGSVSRSCLCPNGEAYKKYIWSKYHMLAKTHPDFIWVDDDIRMHHHTVAFACFCPACIALFNEKNKADYTRETLVEALDTPKNGAVRAAWLQHNNDSISKLLRMLRECVHEVDAHIELGLMTSGITWGSYSYPDFGNWLHALDAKKARPGGGFSDDDHPLDMLRKLFECERQIGLYPQQLSDIQYEMENFPYQRLSKAIHTVMLECTACLAVGHSGIAFNVLAYDDYPELLDEIRRYMPLWSKMTQLSKGFQSVGLYSCFSLNHPARRTVSKGDWFNSSYAQKVEESNILAQIGIPLTTMPQGANACILVGTMAEGFTDEELHALLRKGVLMDGPTLEILLARGFGEYCGVRIAETANNGTRERLSKVPFNGFAADTTRDAYVTFWGADSKSFILEAAAQGVRMISELENILGESLGPCASLYENSFGGRVAVMGYMPWRFLHSPEKRHQMNEICDWLCQGHMPVRIEECLKVVPFVRKAPQGEGMLIVLINCFLDATGPFHLVADAKSTSEVNILEVSGVAKHCERVTAAADGRLRMQLESMNPWEARVLYIGNI